MPKTDRRLLSLAAAGVILIVLVGGWLLFDAVRDHPQCGRSDWRLRHSGTNDIARAGDLEACEVIRPGDTLDKVRATLGAPDDTTDPSRWEYNLGYSNGMDGDCRVIVALDQRGRVSKLFTTECDSGMTDQTSP